MGKRVQLKVWRVLLRIKVKVMSSRVLRDVFKTRLSLRRKLLKRKSLLRRKLLLMMKSRLKRPLLRVKKRPQLREMRPLRKAPKPLKVMRKPPTKKAPNSPRKNPSQNPSQNHSTSWSSTKGPQQSLSTMPTPSDGSNLTVTLALRTAPISCNSLLKAPLLSSTSLRTTS